MEIWRYGALNVTNPTFADGDKEEGVVEGCEGPDPSREDKHQHVNQVLRRVLCHENHSKDDAGSQLDCRLRRLNNLSPKAANQKAATPDPSSATLNELFFFGFRIGPRRFRSTSSTSRRSYCFYCPYYSLNCKGSVGLTVEESLCTR